MRMMGPGVPHPADVAAMLGGPMERSGLPYRNGLGGEGPGLGPGMRGAHMYPPAGLGYPPGGGPPPWGYGAMGPMPPHMGREAHPWANGRGTEGPSYPPQAGE